MRSIAHQREDGQEQTVSEHAHGVADLAAMFAKHFDGSAMAEQCGLAHDLGKYSEASQKRIRGGSKKVDHSTAGAVELMKLGNMAGALCVAGHHTGLMDMGTWVDAIGMDTFAARMKGASNIPPYPAFQESDIRAALHRIENPRIPTGGMKEAFYVRMLFSCLVDADYLDTELFMRGDVGRAGHADLRQLRERVLDAIQQRGYLNHADGVNGIRSSVLSDCLRQGPSGPSADSEIWSLTVPTGGGKTFASLAFAMERAYAAGYRRVIYVVPYCSIIDQTVREFEAVLGADNVLAHYAEATWDDTSEGGSAKRLAAENWDAPVIVTTSVQFFESLFASRTSKCRKLHNIADSVVIYDEAQMLPLDCLLPCVHAMAELSLNYHVCSVLCTATQPAIKGMLEGYDQRLRVQEICGNPNKTFEVLARVQFRDIGQVSDNALAGMLEACGQVLCIVSTRKAAQEIFRMLPQDGAYHLSTLMTPTHRKLVLEEIQQRLRDGKPCRVVSTSLVEAGVDLDFPTVFRELSGLDSCVQAGGRCNREGLRPRDESIVSLFTREGAGRVSPREERRKDECRRVMASYGDITTPDAVESYFRGIYHAEGGRLDADGIITLLSARKMAFRTASDRFRIIRDGSQKTVFVPGNGEAIALAEKAVLGTATKQDFRRLGLWAINVRESQFEALLPHMDKVDDDMAVLRDMHYYSAKTGLCVFGE